MDGETVCFKYADDCTIIIIVSVFANNDSAPELINKFSEWSSSNLTKCNPCKKCKELVFRKKRHNISHPRGFLIEINFMS